MTNTDRVMIFPSRANHVLMKQRVVAANKGLNLLKRKRDALELKLREILAELQKQNRLLNKIMQDALFSIAKARYMDTDFKPIAVIKPERADVYLRIKTGKVVGVSLPKFELVIRPSSCFPLTGLSRGGKHVEKVREKFQEAIKLLISLASLKYSTVVLMEAVRQNNMRINGLDYVLIPRFIRTVMYISEELDEYEREDFYRLKRSQAKQRKAKEKFTALIKKLNAVSDEFLIPLPETIEEVFDEKKFVEKHDGTSKNEAGRFSAAEINETLDNSENVPEVPETAEDISEIGPQQATESEAMINEPEDSNAVNANAQEPDAETQPPPPQ